MATRSSLRLDFQSVGFNSNPLVQSDLYTEELKPQIFSDLKTNKTELHSDPRPQVLHIS